MLLIETRRYVDVEEIVDVEPIDGVQACLLHVRGPNGSVFLVAADLKTVARLLPW